MWGLGARGNDSRNRAHGIVPGNETERDMKVKDSLLINLSIVKTPWHAFKYCIILLMI